MKFGISGISATGFYVTGLVVGSTFGFVAGILFVIVALLLKSVLSNKEKEIGSIPSSSAQDHSQTDEDTVSSYQA